MLYLQAVIDFHNGLLDKFLKTFLELADGDKCLQLMSYAISTRETAPGQLYDIMGERQLAIRHYELLADESALPEMVNLAQHGLQVTHSTPETAPGILLREYVTQSPLACYRTY